VQGPRTNRDFLIELLGHPAFLAGDLSTHFIDDHLGDVLGAEPAPGLVRDAAWAATLHGWASRPRTLPSLRTGYRNNPFADPEVRYQLGELPVIVRYAELGDRSFRVTTILGEADPVVTRLRHVQIEGARVSFEDEEGHRRSARVLADGLRHHVMVAGRTIVLAEQPRFPESSAESAADGAFAPMPGKIVKVLVAAGDVVRTGQTLVIMEAMKMEHSIGAPHEGVVAEVCVAEGQQVSEGHVVVVVHQP